MLFPIETNFTAKNREGWARNPYGTVPTSYCQRLPWRFGNYGRKCFGKHQHPAEIYNDHKDHYFPQPPQVPNERNQGGGGAAADTAEEGASLLLQDEPANPVLPSNPYSKYALDHAGWQNGDFALNLEKFLNKPAALHSSVYADTLKFCLVGCQGVDNYFYTGEGGKAFGLIAANIAQSENPDVNVLLGDNVYHNGVTHPSCDLFDTCFYKSFRELKAPSFALLGNHDYNIHSQQRWSAMANPSLRKLDRAMCQVYHSYIKHWGRDTARAMSRESRWNMPFRYYTLTSHKIKTHFFFIDSNMILFDMAQQQWLRKQYTALTCGANRMSDYRCVLLSHHPVKYYSERTKKGVETPDCWGRRSSPEWKKYVQNEPGLVAVPSCFQAEEFTEIPHVRSVEPDIARNTIGKCLQFLLETYELKFEVMFAAHEHLLAYEPISLMMGRDEHKHTMHQFLSGGGGAKLNKIVNELESANGYCESLWGYMSVEMNVTQISVAIKNTVGGFLQDCIVIKKLIEQDVPLRSPSRQGGGRQDGISDALSTA